MKNVLNAFWLSLYFIFIVVVLPVMCIRIKSQCKCKFMRFYCCVSKKGTYLLEYFSMRMFLIFCTVNFLFYYLLVVEVIFLCCDSCLDSSVHNLLQIMYWLRSFMNERHVLYWYEWSLLVWRLFFGSEIPQ